MTAKTTPDAIRLSAGFLRILDRALAGDERVAHACAGVLEGRELEGRYRLEITAARLVRMAEEPAQSRPANNGQVR